MEGAVIFASLVVGVALTEQLTSLHALLRHRQIVRWSALPLLFAFFVQMTIIMLWWALANQSDRAITIAAFLPVFFTLVMTYLLASASLPDPDEPKPVDLAVFWARESRYLWTLLLAMVLFGNGKVLIDAIGEGDSVWHFVRDRWVDNLLTLLIALAAIFRRRWLDWVTILALSIGPLSWLGRSIN